MVVWSSLAEARRCLNGESSCKYEVLLSFEDRELPYQDSYSELKGAWAASRLRGFINISDRSELPRHMRKWHWSWVKVGLAREVSDWSGVSYMSDPAHRHLGRSLVFRSLKCLVVPRSEKIRGESGSAIARAKRTARTKSVATARRVTGRPVTVKGKRHASVRAAAASAKAGLGAFARKTAKRRRADCYLAEVEEVRSLFPLRH